MTKWQETALVFFLVGVVLVAAGHFEGAIVVIGSGLMLAGGGDPA